MPLIFTKKNYSPHHYTVMEGLQGKAVSRLLPLQSLNLQGRHALLLQITSKEKFDFSNGIATFLYSGSCTVEVTVSKINVHKSIANVTKL